MSATDFVPYPDPKPVLRDDALYAGDCGHVFCGRHAGATARYSGRTIAGQRVCRLTAFDAAIWRQEAPDLPPMCCEICGSTGGLA